MRTLIVLLAAAFVMVGIPFASANTEAHQDCEAGQPSIGYGTTTTFWQIYYEETAGTEAGDVFVCEGEHWDGEDTVHSTQPACTPTTNADPTQPFVGLCLGSDPNDMEGGAPGVLTPLGLRVSAKTGDLQLYAATNILLVGRAAVYVSEDTAAVYARDNTPGDVLASAVSAARITKGYPSDEDCDHATYQRSAAGEVDKDGRPVCGRDNTAITVHHSLLA